MIDIGFNEKPQLIKIQWNEKMGHFFLLLFLICVLKSFDF
jgi:hypothetical protein